MPAELLWLRSLRHPGRLGEGRRLWPLVFLVESNPCLQSTPTAEHRSCWGGFGAAGSQN